MKQLELARHALSHFPTTPANPGACTPTTPREVRLLQEWFAVFDEGFRQWQYLQIRSLDPAVAARVDLPCALPLLNEQAVKALARFESVLLHMHKQVAHRQPAGMVAQTVLLLRRRLNRLAHQVAKLREVHRGEYLLLVRKVFSEADAWDRGVAFKRLASGQLLGLVLYGCANAQERKRYVAKVLGLPRVHQLAVLYRHYPRVYRKGLKPLETLAAG